jgi:WD40 repeat protein/serine/threonine protein kinase
MNEEEIFYQALGRSSPAERAAYLQQACAGNPALRASVEALLRANIGATGFLEPARPALAVTVDDPISERPGTVIGPYKLLEQIGEGGFGVVFMAEQTQPVRRKVALKVLKPGMDTRQVVARFEAERQALAIMDHPNIARVFDGGATSSGRPYFVMELVKGAPITAFCDQNHLTPKERLELFVSVCQAIQHAHQKGIIHRDLKPSNILVSMHDTTPVVKVIDFGVAKALGQELTEKTLFTGFAQMIGTPLYMSPEQAGQSGLDSDTRSDIYSLGVLLYELLTSTTPFDKERLRTAGYDEVRRIIREEEPARPSTRISTLGQAASTVPANRKSDPRRLSQLFRGELDWIVMKALEKDRNHRYETASAFAADVLRYLHDEPVLACPPSALYRFRKFARRNKAILATVSAVAVAVVVAVGSLVGAVKVLAASNAQITDKQQQTKEALDRETLAKNEKDRALQREIQARKELVLGLYFQRIASAERELATNNAAQADELLDECPLHLRGWEWHYLKRLRYQPPLTFAGHSNWVMGMAFSPDGKQVASASATLQGLLGEIKVWDRATGQVRHTLLGHAFPVVVVAFSPDGKRLASAGWDGKVKVWDLATGEPLHTLKGHGEYVSCVAFSPDGKLIASGSGDRTVKVWDAATYQELRTLYGHGGGLYGVAFGPDSKLLTSAGGDRTARLWDATTGKELHVLEGHPGPVLGVAFSRDGRRLASAGADGAVKLWDPATGRHLFTLRDSSVLTMCLSFSPDGRRLATGSWEKTVKVWDLVSRQEALTLRGHGDMVTGVAFSPDGLQIASASLDKTVRVWNAAPPGRPAGQVLTLRGHGGAVSSVAYRPDGKVLASAGGIDTTVRLWDTASGEEVRILRGHASPVADVAFSRDGRRLASADIAGVIKVWDAATGKVIRTFRGFSVRVALSPDGRRVASAVEGATVYVWDADTGKEVVTPFRAHAGPLISLAFSPDGKRLATGSWDLTAKVWDADTGTELLTLGGHSHLIYGVAFSPDGKRLATASWDKTAKVWDATTGKLLHTLRGHTDRVFSAVFNPDGKLLATASWDDTTKVWDAATGKTITTLHGRGGYIGLNVAFSPDGRRLATASGSRSKGEVTIWDATGWNEKPKEP